ncbi:type 1 glutamine amidotransferase [Candidatus Gottesmanbacteria bacterium]|nr:type 1 glutamine amidotransferase [Candidatus Gottesmanbacteria bacterium]
MKINEKILLLLEELYEDLEFWYPKIRLEEEGIKVVVAAPEKRVYHGKKGMPAEPDTTLDSLTEKEFTGIIIPGGFAPDKLRRYPKVLELVKSFDKKKKLIAFICHAGWVPISAKILKGRKATSVSAIKDDMENAGVIWKDSPVVVDKNLVSSRTPKDLGNFCKAIIKFLQK